MLIALVENMVSRHGNPQFEPHIDDAVEELRNVNSRDRKDKGLWKKPLRALGHPLPSP